MKEFKLTKGIQMILGAVLLFIVGIIIVAVVLNNNDVMAAYVEGGLCTECLGNGCTSTDAGRLALATSEFYHWYKCDKCNATFGVKLHEGASHSNGGKCTVCYYQVEIHEYTSTKKTYEYFGDGKHQVYHMCSAENCTSRYGWQLEECVLNSYGTACTLCGHAPDSGGSDSGGSNSGGSDSGGSDSGGSNPGTPHTHSYTKKYNETQHWYECTCGDETTAYNHACREWTDAGNGKHSGTCVECPATVTAEHKLGSYTEKDGTNHTRTCADCEYVETKTHNLGSYTEKDGTNHTRTCSDCKYVETKTHNFGNYTGKDGTNHTRTCADCKYVETKAHSFGAETDKGNGTHSRTCSACKYEEKAVEHTYVWKSSSNGENCVGTCICGAEKIEEHAYGNWTNVGNKSHDRYCKKCSIKDSGNHVGANHSNGGYCDICKLQYDAHEPTTEVADYAAHKDLHVVMYKCSNSKCTSMYTGEAEKHSGVSHDSLGKCEKCEYQCEIHDPTDEIVGYTDKTKTTHTPLYKCSFEGCEGTHKIGKTEPHTGATHDNGGICTVCKHQYQVHEKTNTKVDCIGHQNGHTTYYKCSFNGCAVPFAGVTESHTGGTHANKGICTVCKYQYQEHGVSNTFAGYKQTKTGHTKTYKCTFNGCEEVHLVGNEEKHTGATHDNDGKCTICEYQYEKHGQTKEVLRYEQHPTTHIILYKCSHKGCTTSYVGEAQDHSGATHENGGKCNICKYTYQKHDPADKPERYETTANAHTPIYKCTFTGCTKTHTGETENHLGGTHENGGKCEKCQYKYQTHGVSTEIKYYDIKDQNHTPIYKCTYNGCEGTHTGTTQSHLGGTHDNGGKCTSCLYQYQQHVKTETIAEYKQTETGHTAMYKCSQNGCTALFAGCEQSHTLSQWSSNGSETHGAECTVCKYEVNKNHNYDKNGTCGDCGAKQPRLEVSSKIYKIDDKYIAKVKAGTTVKQFIENIGTNATEIKLYDKDNNLQDDAKVMKTGMSLELKYLNETRTFKIAVNGDATGDGKVEFSDMIAINMHLLNRRTLQDEYFVAADVTKDAKVEFNDFLKINIYMLSRISEL